VLFTSGIKQCFEMSQNYSLGVFYRELTCTESADIFINMSKIEEIEEAVEQLSPKELSVFRTWFSAYDAAQWDAAIEIDVAAGKLDSLADEALSDYRAGSVRQL
jgi:hypothetical protein